MALVAVDQRVVRHRLGIGECLQLPGMGTHVDNGSGERAFEANEDLAIEAAAIPLGALLEQGMQLVGNVLEGQGVRACFETR